MPSTMCSHAVQKQEVLTRDTRGNREATSSRQATQGAPGRKFTDLQPSPYIPDPRQSPQPLLRCRTGLAVTARGPRGRTTSPGDSQHTAGGPRGSASSPGDSQHTVGGPRDSASSPRDSQHTAGGPRGRASSTGDQVISMLRDARRVATPPPPPNSASQSTVGGPIGGTAGNFDHNTGALSSNQWQTPYFQQTTHRDLRTPGAAGLSFPNTRPNKTTTTDTKRTSQRHAERQVHIWQPQLLGLPQLRISSI